MNKQIPPPSQSSSLRILGINGSTPPNARGSELNNIAPSPTESKQIEQGFSPPITALQKAQEVQEAQKIGLLKPEYVAAVGETQLQKALQKQQQEYAAHIQKVLDNPGNYSEKYIDHYKDELKKIQGERVATSIVNPDNRQSTEINTNINPLEPHRTPPSTL